LLSYDFMDWENILSGKSIEIFFRTLDDGDLSGFSDAVILWIKGMEFLVRVPNSSEAPPGDFHKTATAIFAQYGLPLYAEFDIYFYSTNKKAIIPEDAILHTLLVEPGSVRYATYALLLLKKIEKEIDKTHLLKEAVRFGVKNQVIGMLEFLETHKRPEGQPLPSWNEFILKVNCYAVIA